MFFRLSRPYTRYAPYAPYQSRGPGTNPGPGARVHSTGGPAGGSFAS